MELSIANLLLQYLTSSAFVQFAVSHIPPQYGVLISTILIVLLCVSELLAQLPTKYNSIFQVVVAVVKNILAALNIKTAASPTPEKPNESVNKTPQAVDDQKK